MLASCNNGIHKQCRTSAANYRVKSQTGPIELYQTGCAAAVLLIVQRRSSNRKASVQAHQPPPTLQTTSARQDQQPGLGRPLPPSATHFVHDACSACRRLFLVLQRHCVSSTTEALAKIKATAPFSDTVEAMRRINSLHSRLISGLL
ncbi:hypothetical protein H4R24_000942 [Coemansia sp. RSA 988]|nr:hypothetical protein H4R24_000942 [Coemansia sp. RSA 988]